MIQTIRKGDLFKRPECIIDAQKSKSQKLIVEILIFIAVYMVVQMIASILATIPIMIALFSSNEFVLASAQGDVAAAMQVAMNLVASGENNIFVVTNLYITVVSIAVSIIFCRCVEKRSFKSMGIFKKGFGAEYLVGLLIGFVMFALAVAICVMTGTLEIKGWSSDLSFGWLVVFFIGFLIQGMSEELLCRSYFMVSLARRQNLLVAIILNSLVFALLHLGNSGLSLLALVNLMLFGIFASVYFIKRGSVWGIGAIHSMWNFAQGNVFGIKVSGMGLSESLLTSNSTATGTLVNGGAFGLEGGIAVTIVLIVAIVLISLTKGKYTAEED